MAEAVFVCPDNPQTLVAFSWSTGQYRTWVHAGYHTSRYTAPRKTLCGKPVYDCALEAEGDLVAIAVTCVLCSRALERIAAHA